MPRIPDTHARSLTTRYFTHTHAIFTHMYGAHIHTKRQTHIHRQTHSKHDDAMHLHVTNAHHIFADRTGFLHLLEWIFYTFFFVEIIISRS